MSTGLELIPGGTASRRTLAETAAVELHRMILSGELPSGTPLRLVELARRLEMSQMPVREGLRRLEALGLVDIVAHKGAWVRELSEDDLRDTQETRIALESLAVRAAAARFTDAAASVAAVALAEHVRLAVAGDVLGARRAHTEFHFTIYRAGGSRWLPRAIEPVWQNSERYRFSAPQDRDRIDVHRQEHEAILDACIARDEERAEAALRRHLERAMQRGAEAVQRRGPHGGNPR
jgi:DNA-binding GntR family transcriptional regulator